MDAHAHIAHQVVTTHLVFGNICLGLELLSFLVIPTKIELRTQLRVGGHRNTGPSVGLKHKPMQPFLQ